MILLYLKNVTYVSEHLLPISPVYTEGGVRGKDGMVTPTPAYRQAGAPSPVKGEGK